MTARRGVLVAYAFTTVLQQPVVQSVRWAPPSPCTGDSTETRVRRGNVIQVPNLDGMPMLRAKATLARLALQIDVRTVRMDGPAGVVIAQSPQFGTSATTGDVVLVCVRRAPAIPDVIGLTFDAARVVLQDAGYDVAKTNSFVDRASRVGVVFRQQPSAGSAVTRGSVDTLVVGMASPISTMGAARPSQSPPTQTQPPQVAPPTVPPPAPSPGGFVTTREPMDWIWLVWLVGAAGIALAVWTAVVRLRDRRQLATLRVSPRQHPGRPRVVVAKRRGQ